MKRESLKIGGFPITTPREECGVTLPDDETMSLATVYVGYQCQSGAVANVSLVAGLMGHRQVIATAGIPAGFNGIAITATGIVADGFHIEIQGGASDSRMNLALGVRRCCSGHAVYVEPRLQQMVVEDAGNVVPVRPFGQMEGLYRVQHGTGTSSCVLDAIDRVIHLWVLAPGGNNASVDGLPGTGDGLRVTAGRTLELFPRGNLTGPRTLDFNSSASWALEIVR